MACFYFPVQPPTNHVRFARTILAESSRQQAIAIRIVTCVDLRPDVVKPASYSAVKARDVLRRLNAAQEPVPVQVYFRSQCLDKLLTFEVHLQITIYRDVRCREISNG